MDASLKTLPDDPIKLRAMTLALQAKIQFMDTELARLKVEQAEMDRLKIVLAAEEAELRRALEEERERNDRLEHLLDQLRRLKFGKRSEKLDPDQLNLALEDLEQALATYAAEEEKKDPELKRARTDKRRAKRGSLPEHLPHIDVVIEPEETACPCCGGELHAIGEDSSKRLDIIPARYQVIVTHRPKYACRSCEGSVVQAPAPARLVEGGLPTERLVAQVLVNKYADHCPLYRQAQILARQGIEINRSTMASWVGIAAAELKPVEQLLRQDVLRSSKIFVDETKAPVLDPGRGQVKNGYFWTIAREDRPWGGIDPPVVVYTYAPGRGAKHAISLLDDFVGVLQTDGYAAYKTFAALKSNQITIAHCWAHARRKYFDLAKGKTTAGIAGEALKTIAELYAIEAEIRGSSAELRQAVRQEKTKPILAAFKSWCQAKLDTVSGKSLIAEAIRYTLNHWDGLTRFLDDGRIEIDSNAVERHMRPIALNRKNSLFAGHDEGAENWALIASIIETCKLNNVNPELYLADVLTKLVNNWPNSRLAELTPWAWAKSIAP
jgi:transposase